MGHFQNCLDSRTCFCEPKQYAVLLGLSLSTFFAELFGGLVSGSLALLADSFHVLMDAAGSGIAIAVALLVRRGFSEKSVRDRGALVSAIILLVAATQIALEGFDRYFSPRDISLGLMLPVAVFGLLINIAQMRYLSRYRHEHKTHRMMSLHVLSDTAMSFAVIASGIVIWLSGALWIDPVLSLGIALWISVQTIRALQGKEHHDHSGHHH